MLVGRVGCPCMTGTGGRDGSHDDADADAAMR
jgi:hypothetical protein